MKTLLLLALLASTTSLADEPKCGPMKFHYGDVVRVIDKNSLYLGCEGSIESFNDIGCTYDVTNLCGLQTQSLEASQLKLLRKREDKKE